MPFPADPFDVIRRLGRPSNQDSDDVPDDGSSSIPIDAPTPFSMALAQQRQQAPADLAYAQQLQAKQDAANQKAQAAQAKIDAANQAAQDKADADNLKAAGAVTQAATQVGPDGRARVVQQQQLNPDGTPAYKPEDLGVQQTPSGPFDVQRTQWGSQQWNDPYSPATANLKLNPTGQLMATSRVKGASALPQKDVSDQGVDTSGVMTDAQGNPIKDAQGNPLPNITVAPGAPIDQPQVRAQTDAEEQKLIKQAALQRVNDTVGKDSADAAQTLADATDAHSDAVDAAGMAAEANKNVLAPGYDADKAAAALQAAQQDAIAKANAKNDAKADHDSKLAEFNKAKLDPLAYLQSKGDPLDFLQPQQTATPPAAGTPPASPGQSWQLTPAQQQSQKEGFAEADHELAAAGVPPSSGSAPPPNPGTAPSSPAPTSPAPAPQPTTDPNNGAGPVSGASGQPAGSTPPTDASGNPAPVMPAEKGTWGSWLRNVTTKSVADFSGAVGDIMKGVGAATDLVNPGNSLGLNKLLLPVSKALMSPAGFQNYQNQLNAPNAITAAGNQIKANADALASGSSGLKLPDLGPLKGPTLQVDPNRKDLGTSIISGAAGMAPMLAGGEFETPLWMNSGYQSAVAESKKNGDTPLVTQAKGIVGAVTMGGVSKLFNVFGASPSKFFNPVLWGSRETADGTTTPILRVLQNGAKATTANLLTQIAKLAGKGAVEGAGFSVGGQVATGDNPYAPADAAKNTSDDVSSAGSLAALQAVLGAFTHGKTIHQISKGVDDLVSQTNEARTNPPAGQPPQPPLDRATVIAGLIHQNQVARAQDSFAHVQKQYAALDGNDSLTPQQRLGAKMQAVAQVPAELRSAVVAHLDAAADAQRQTDEAMKVAAGEQAKLPPTNPAVANRSDAYIQANQQDILQSQQSGQPRQRQLFGNDTDADILAEAARRQKLADLASQRNQVVAGIAGNLKDSLDQTVSLSGTPEGRAALLELNRYNASQPSGAPRASATTLQNAMDLAPRPAGDLSLPSAYVGHYLSLAHQIEQLGDPNQKVMATAAAKLTNSRALTDDERTLLLGSPDGSQPPAITPDGQPFAKVEGQRPILTDAGLARLKALVPAAADVLPRSEQAQLEAQPPPLPQGGKAVAQPPPLNNGLGTQHSGPVLAQPDPGLAKMDDETLQVQHGSVTAAIAKAKANGGDSPPAVYAHRDRLASEMARRAAAVQPAQPNPLGAPAGAKEGDEIEYTRPTRDGQSVQTRGEVTQVGPAHYRVVDAHDGVERTVPIVQRAQEPNRLSEAGDRPGSNGQPQRAHVGKGASGVHLPGIDPSHIDPQHLETARLLSETYSKVQAAAERLGIDGFSAQSSPEGFIGLSVHLDDLSKIQLDLPRLTQNLAKLRTPAERAARLEEVVDEELRHVALETVAGEDGAGHSAAKADATFSNLWASASKFQKKTILDLYQKGALAFVDPDRAAKNSSRALENASDANKGREYMRILSQLQARGRTSEIADLLTPATRTFYQKVVAYLRHVFARLNDPMARQLLDRTEQLLQAHPKDEEEDNLDLSPPSDRTRASGNARNRADVALPSGETLPARYELAELGSLSPSHRNGQPNPDYPHGLNERDYSLPAEKQKNEAMASNFDPRRVVTDNPDAVNGPPVVDQKGVVLGGNRRTMLLSDPRAYARYRPYLQENAARFGVDPADVNKMSQPVLVRRVDAPEEKRPELIRRLNETPTGGIDSANDAVSAGKQISPDVVKDVSNLFSSDPDKTPLQHLTDGNTRSIAARLLDAGAIRPHNREKYVGGDGNLTPEGARFARSVLLGGVIPDAQLLREISDTPTETKLLNGLSPLYTMKARGADIAPLREAVELEADRQRLGIRNVGEYQSQGNLAGIGKEATPEGKTLQAFLAGIKGNEARRAFTQLQNLVSPLEPGQTGLFGESNRRSVADVTDAEMNHLIASSKKITKAADALRSVVGSPEVTGQPVHYAGPLPMPGMAPGELSPEQRAVEAKFAKWVQDDPDRAARAYAELPETEGGRVIDMDEARKLSPDYNASRHAKTLHSVSVQKVVNSLAIQKLLGDAIEALRPGDTMGLTAGGPGSGKGKIKNLLPAEWNGAKFVYDGVLRKAEIADFFIGQAKARGAKTQLWYVHVPVEKAVDQAVGRAEHDGRVLPIRVLATGHSQAQRTVLALLQKYKDDPAVNIKVIDNSGPVPRVVDNPLAYLQNERTLYRDADETEQRARQAFEANAHRLSDPDAVSIFRTGKTSEAGAAGRSAGGLESGAGRGERGLRPAEEAAPDSRPGAESGAGSPADAGGAGRSPDEHVGGAAIADHPAVERPLAQYVSALRQGELDLNKPVDFPKEYQTDTGEQPSPALAARAKELEVQPDEVEGDASLTSHQLFQKYLDVADRIARTFDNIPGQGADDTRQVARVALQKAAESYDPTKGVPFRGYAPRVVRNALRDNFRAQSRKAVEQPTLDRPVNAEEPGATAKDQVEAAGPTPDRAVAQRDAHAQLRDYIGRVSMPPESRKALTALLDGKTQHEIVQELGVSNQRVSAAVGYGLEQLRKVFAEKGITRGDLLGAGAVGDHRFDLPNPGEDDADHDAAGNQAERSTIEERAAAGNPAAGADLARRGAGTSADEPRSAAVRVAERPGKVGPTRDQTVTPEFKRWFGDSKMVGADGKPSVFYHGSKVGGLDQFDLDKQVAHRRGVDRGPAGFYFGDKDIADNFAHDRTQEPPVPHPENVHAVHLKIERPFTNREKLTGKLWADFLQAFPEARKGPLFNHDAALVREGLKDGWANGATLNNAFEHLNVDAPYGHEPTFDQSVDLRKRYTAFLKDHGFDGFNFGDGTGVVAFDPEQVKSATRNRGTFDPGDPRITHGAAIPDPDFSNAGSYQEAKDAFDKDDPETWPIDADAAAQLKEQSGDPEDNEHVTALNDMIETLKEGEYPPAVIAKAEQARDALVAHLEANSARIEKQGEAWEKFFDHPARDTAYNFDPADSDTWPEKAQAAWNELDPNEPATWPKGLEAAADHAGMVDRSDPETPEIDQDFAHDWMADHVARPEWLKAVDKLPEGESLLRNRAQDERDEEVANEVNRRMAGSPEHAARDQAMAEALAQKEQVRQEVAPHVPADKFMLRSLRSGKWEHYQQGGDEKGTPVPDEVAQRIEPFQARKNAALDAYWAKRSETERQVKDEMGAKPLRDYRKPMDGGESPDDPDLRLARTDLNRPDGWPQEWRDEHDRMRREAGIPDKPVEERTAEDYADPRLKAVNDAFDAKYKPQIEAARERVAQRPGGKEDEQGSLFGAGVHDAPTDTNRFPKDGFAVEHYRDPDPAHEKHLLDELPSAERARAQIAEKFLGIPIRDAIDKIPLDSDIQKGAELLHNIKDQAVKFLAPQTRTDAAELAGNLYSHRAAEYRLMRAQAIEAVKSARAFIDRKGKKAREFTLSIAHAIESDTSHPDPEARPIVDLFTEVNNRFRDMVRELPGTHFRNYIVDYFPHMFADRDQARAAKFYERKLQGSAAFVKHRSIPTIQEAYDAGLHLKSDNAADLFLMKWDEMLRYKMGQDYLADLKENNLARQFDSDAAAPAGWSQIDHRIGKSTVSVPAHPDTPGAYEVKNNQAPLPGMEAEKKFGVDKAIHYYAPDSVAQVLNNHLAPGLSDFALYKGSMMLANSLNQANLGFSAFHLGFVTCDSMISKQADALESLIRDKDPVAAAKKAVQAYVPGVAPVMSYLSGSKLMKTALAPGTAENSELNAMIDAVVKAGGDVKRGEIFSNGWVDAMLQNWRKGTALGYAQAGVRFPAALIEAAAHPILAHIVPRVKLGVFMDMARRELRRLGPDASHQDTLKALQGAWASVDNRLGEFAYDNLHMHQGAKHVAFLFIRSVGWDLGTARELGLGSLDALKAGKNILSGNADADDFTHRLAYAISLPMMLGAYGTLATYLATGKAPQDIRDYFFPPTGEIDPYGHKMRFAPPTYGKDVAGLFHQPGQTAINKLNPIWANLFSIWQNRDFWGNQIYSPDDPAFKKGAEMLRYEAGAFEPFAVSGYLQNRKMGVGAAKAIAPFFGLTPAASWIDKSPAEERAQELEDRNNAGKARTSDEAASSQKYLALRNQFAKNDPAAGATPDDKARARQTLADPKSTADDKAEAQKILDRPDITTEEKTRRSKANAELLRQALQDGTIKPGEVGKLVDEARKTPLQRMFEGVIEHFRKDDPKNAYLQAKSIWDLATPAEQKLLYPKMVSIWGTARTNKLTVDPQPVNPAAQRPVAKSKDAKPVLSAAAP